MKDIAKLHEALLLVEQLLDFGEAPLGLRYVRDLLEDLYIGADNHAHDGRTFYCSVCRINQVDVPEGEDTCQDCMMKQREADTRSV